MLLRGYAEDKTEAVRREFIKWGVQGGRPLASLEWVQGHYHILEIVAAELSELELHFGYMDQDTRLPVNSSAPKPEEWKLIASLPFLTSFSTWESAKGELFRHSIKNRYLDYGGPLAASDWSGRLDEKYKPLFPELQRVLLRMRYADMLGIRFLEESAARQLANSKYDPDLLYQLWSIDPLMASLLSLRYVDTPEGQRNPHPPDLGSTYDYMVTTAWQPRPEERFCYIAQKVSRKTTPPIDPPGKPEGKQEDGFTRENGTIKYRVVAGWLPPKERISDEYGYFEAPMYDVRRHETGRAESLTQRYDSTAPPEQRIFDSPVHGPITIPDLNETPDRLSQTQRDALALRRTLDRSDSRVPITPSQIAAYAAMLSTPLSQFFPPAQDQKIQYTDWLEAIPAPRKVRYSARSIDLFGRTSDFVQGDDVPVTHNAATPLAEDVRVRAEGTPPGETLHVSWRFGPHQIGRGAPVNHFNICWRKYDPDSAEYRSGEIRRFKHWQQQTLSPPISAAPPIQVTIQSVQELEGVTLTGVIKEVRSVLPSPEVAIWLPGKRLATLVTDQCFFSRVPFVDIAAAYGRAMANLTDRLKITFGGVTYDVVQIEEGETLRVTIALTKPVNDTDPAETLRAALAPNSQFSLVFETVRKELDWTQPIGTSHVRESSGGAMDLLLPTPLGVELTGREAWLRNAAWITYEEPPGTTRRVPIKDHGTIHLSASELRFGRTLRPNPDPQRPNLVPVAVDRFVTVTNRSSAPLLIEAVSPSENATPFEVVFQSSEGSIVLGGIRFQPCPCFHHRPQPLQVMESGGSCFPANRQHI